MIRSAQLQHEATKSFVQMMVEAQSDKELSNKTLDWLARILLENNPSSDSSVSDQAMTVIEEHLKLLDLIDTAYQSKNRKAPTPEQRHFYLEASKLKLGPNYAHATSSQIDMLLAVSSSTENLFNKLTQSRIYLSAQDVETMRSLQQKEVRHLETARGLSNPFAKYAKALSNYTSIPGAPLREGEGATGYQICEPDFKGFVSTSHREWNALPAESRPPFSEYFCSQLATKTSELQTRTVYQSLKGDFPDRATVDALMKAAELEQKFGNLPFEHALIFVVISHTLQAAFNVGSLAESNPSDLEVVTTTLQLQSLVSADMLRVNNGKKPLLLKKMLADKYEDQLMNDVDAWAMDYVANEELYKEVLRLLPTSASATLCETYAPYLLKPDVDDSVFHLEHCVNSIKAKRRETPDYDIAKAVNEYCDTRGLLRTT
jgi:hypothetical protein